MDRVTPPLIMVNFVNWQRLRPLENEADQVTMSSSTFQWCYSILEVSSTSEWEAVRLSYRRKLRAFHPDLADTETKEAPELASREDRFKEIVHAYRLLASWYKRYGALPGPHQAIPAYLTKEQPRRTQRRKQKAASASPGSARLAISPWHSVLVGGFLVSVGVAAAANFLANDKADDEHRRLPDRSRLALGMEPTHVVETQGVPHFTRGSVWFYGKSGVIFDKGCVIGWEDDDPAPADLRRPESALPESASPDTARTYESRRQWFVKGRCEMDGS